MLGGKVYEFVEKAERRGGVCHRYMQRIAACERKEDLFRIVCDVNGGEWLFCLHEKGVGLPIDDFVGEYANFLDGKKVVEYPSGYTSKMYCRAEGVEIVATTTLLWLLECKDVKVVVPDNAFPTVSLSDGSSAEITLGKGARLNLETYGTSSARVHGDETMVRRTSK